MAHGWTKGPPLPPPDMEPLTPSVKADADAEADGDLAAGSSCSSDLVFDGSSVGGGVTDFVGCDGSVSGDDVHDRRPGSLVGDDADESSESDVSEAHSLDLHLRDDMLSNFATLSLHVIYEIDCETSTNLLVQNGVELPNDSSLSSHCTCT